MSRQDIRLQSIYTTGLNRLFKTLAILIVCVCSLSSAVADNIRSNKTDRYFQISQSLAIKGQTLPMNDLISIRNLITKNGGIVEASKSINIKKITLPFVSAKKVRKIPGIYNADACSIDITAKSVKILFTSEQAAGEAIKILSSLVVRVGGVKCFQGGHYSWDAGSNDMDDKGKKSHMATEISQLMTELGKMHSGTSTELILVTPFDWMIESPVIEDMTKTTAIYSETNGYARCNQLKAVLEKASSRNITVTAVFNLEEECRAFSEVTGHSIYSVEGMRFLRAALSEWHDTCGLENARFICTQNGTYEKSRFEDFLQKIAPLTGIRISM